MNWWTQASPWEVVRVSHPFHSKHQVSRYLSGSNVEPLKRILNIARANGCNTILIEAGYLGIDYRSEYSTFYSQLFQSIPDSAHRLHFFALPENDLRVEDPIEVAHRGDYLGYAVIRPLPLGSVSRACVRPPNELAPFLNCSVLDRVHIFDREISVLGFPFMQQDAHFASCAHAAAWMCHQAGALRGDTCSRPAAEVTIGLDATDPRQRMYPTVGLTDAQLNELFARIGMPAAYYAVGASERQHQLSTEQVAQALARILRPYADSGLPALLAFDRHALVALGLDSSGSHCVFHDDQRGPYLMEPILDLVLRMSGDNGDASVHVPLPRKAWLSPEAANQHAARRFVNMGKYLQKNGHAGNELNRYWDPSGNLALSSRAYITKGIDFKRRLQGRGYGRDAQRALLMARLPKVLIVVEFYESSDPIRVVGEALCDATYSAADTPIICWRIESSLLVLPSVSGESTVYKLGKESIQSGIGRVTP